VCCLLHCNDLLKVTARRSVLFECGQSLLGRNLQFCCDRCGFRLLGNSFNINHIARKHCDKVCNKSRQAAACSVHQSASCGIGSQPPASPGAMLSYRRPWLNYACRKADCARRTA